MIGQGSWHTHVPRDQKENVKYRLALLKKARTDRAIQKGVIDACRKDILFYINTFVVQFNPLLGMGSRVGPFITYEFQERVLMDTPESSGRRGILWCWENNKTVVIEKSREMGASWLFLILQDWLGLFHPRSQSMNISHRAEAVDSESPNSLFWKLRFMHAHLPDWLKGTIVERSMYHRYERTQSVNTGEATTSKFGVGGRAADIFFDEFQELHPKAAKEVREKTAFTSNRRFFNGTHLGPDTEFYRLTQSPEIVKIQMHWSRHPEKNKGLYCYDKERKQVQYLAYDGKTDLISPVANNGYAYPDGYDFVTDGSPHGGPYPGVRSPWYDSKCPDVGSAHGIAMALDIDPKGSVVQFFDPFMIATLKQLCMSPLWEGYLEFDDRGQPQGLTNSPGGPLKLWCLLGENDKPEVAPYGAGADISGGTGATPSCFTLTHGVTGQKVAEYVDPRIEPKDFACLCAALCRLFRGADGALPRLTWEHRGPGVNFGIKLLEISYGNIARAVADDKPGKPRSTSIGFNPEGQGKPILLREYDSALRKRQFMNPSEVALDECLSFRHDGKGGVVHAGELSSDPSAARENHGDRVIADALSWKMCREMGNLTSVRTEREKDKEIDPHTFAYRRYLDEIEEAEELVWA